jgi:hypothetical protein
MNAVYKLAETAIKENFETADSKDEILEFLQNSVIDEDEYLRFRISERFNEIMKSLFEAHKKDGLSEEQAEVMNDMKEMVQSYLHNKKTETAAKAKVLLLCKQMGLNATKLDEEELRVLIKVLECSPLAKRGRRK